MVSRKQRLAAKRNIKKARLKWMRMSKKARKKAMPSRSYKVHTKKWDRLVKKLRRKKGIKTPEALATRILGPRAFLKK